MTTAPRARLLDAEGLTPRASTRRAGVFYAAPLKHFPHRAAPLSAVATVRFRELGARAGAAVRECPEGASAVPAGTRPGRHVGLRRPPPRAWRPGADTRALTGAVWSGLHGVAQLWLRGSLALGTGAASIDEALDALFTSFDLKEH
ncbi:TetR/AcrR family transcriptional regulator [Actinacidiphila glaucinigra]|uniref:TetR/AcrR family transcriptional regulator n=1 Tax=Actinacidiphila glaucinigra TaxID=235986 RepID=UPI0033AD848D